MKRIVVIAGSVAFVALIAALIVPLWTKTANISLDPFALKMIVLMVLGCFAVGGGLMFLVFYSARHGYDDAVDHRTGRRDPEEG